MPESGNINGEVAARREIEEHGFAADPFLASDPDCPVLGFNLACAYPFPDAAAHWYRALSAQLNALSPAVYVYPDWETHVTIMTLVNFSLHRRPDASLRTRLQSLINPVSELIAPVLNERVFALTVNPPLLTRRGAILPIADPTGAINRIRKSVSEAIKANAPLCGELTRAGFNVPGIVHSTVMRFKELPPDPRQFVKRFDEIAAKASAFRMAIAEILLTTETRPYMREGSVARRYPLAPA